MATAPRNRAILKTSSEPTGAPLPISVRVLGNLHEQGRDYVAGDTLETTAERAAALGPQVEIAQPERPAVVPYQE